ncbi:hypothetical protein PIB30_059335 [Stylosanthes scabra]|uniref:Uncharacterized protein n=1 Tax=Stylosanthes scabra TaxID=79078 RepID=A0ABU6SM22_9FABA|nr:hypothetical protein [Stylosanthes scabra]
MVSVVEPNMKLSSKRGYEWVKYVVWVIPSKFVDVDGVRRLGPPSSWVREGKKIKIEFLPCSSTERVCHKGRSVFCPFKETYRDFKEFFIKVRSAEDSFPFLFSNLNGGKILNTSELLKWDNDKEYVIDYLEKKIPDCNTLSLKSFFKQRAEKEMSSSQVVKIEKGIEMNKPVERKRPVSLKRLRSEEMSRKKVIDLTEGKCCGKDVSLEEVANFSRSQEGLHGFNGTEDLTSLWCKHHPFSIVADEHFRSKADLELLGKMGKVEAAQLLCIIREWEVQAMEEEKSQREKKADLIEVEKSLNLARDRVVLKEKENRLLMEENGKLKSKVSQLTKEKSGLENRVVELCSEKKEVEVSKKAHGFEMFAAAWDRAKAQVQLFVPGVDLKKMDPVKVVYKGELVDDDQVPVEESDDHDPNPDE